jgi:hypothetical protein
MVKVAVLGATGYTALELLKILLRHPEVEIVAVTSRQDGSPPISSVHPSLVGRLDLALEDLSPEEVGKRADCVFGCLPHCASAEILPRVLAAGAKVVDFSADYRLDDAATYLEWYGHEHPDAARLGNTVYGLPELEAFAPFLRELWDTSDVLGVPLEGAISEFAPGQIELTLKHKPDALAAADDAQVYKRATKGVALRHGCEATFMAKPWVDRAGSGFHMHVSFNNAEGENLCASEDVEGSELLRHAIGGIGQLRVSGAHLGNEIRNQFVKEGFLLPELVPMTQRTPNDSAQHISASFAAGNHTINNQERTGANVIGNHAQ